MGRVDGKVAFITGAARGQGRNHAVRLAQEGADIIAVDVCQEMDGLPYPMPTRADLDETAAQVEAAGRRVVAREADVRDAGGLKAALDEGVAALGRLDIVAANAGISGLPAVATNIEEHTWQRMLDINLTGVWHTAKVAIPHLIASGGGAIVITSSAAGLRGYGNIAAYSAAKTGLVGLMRTLAVDCGPHRIRVTNIAPTQCSTDMIHNEATMRLFCPDKEEPTVEDFAAVSQAMHMLPVPWVEPVDISNALLFLASDEGRYITAISLPVDAGSTQY